MSKVGQLATPGCASGGLHPETGFWVLFCRKRCLFSAFIGLRVFQLTTVIDILAP